MDIGKIEKILAKLAKDGDKQTLSLITELLSEVSKYDKGRKPVNESREQVRQPAPRSLSDRASDILDGNTDSVFNYRQRPQPSYDNRSFSDMLNENRQTYQNPYTSQDSLEIPRTSAPSDMADNKNMRDHADYLLL